jgi:hypothetical protein
MKSAYVGLVEWDQRGRAHLMRRVTRRSTSWQTARPSRGPFWRRSGQRPSDRAEHHPEPLRLCSADATAVSSRWPNAKV